MSSAQPTIPPDDPKRSLTLAQLENLSHVGLVGDTYTITVTGEQTAGRFCVIDMHIPPGGGPPPHRHDFEETFLLLEGQMEATFRGQKSTLRAGETLNIPANAPISFTTLLVRPYACFVFALLPGRKNSFWRWEFWSPLAPHLRPSSLKRIKRHSLRK